MGTNATRLGVWIACLGLAGLAGCKDDPKLVPWACEGTPDAPPAGPPAQGVDLLVVVDNSGSMCEAQAALADTLAPAVSELLALGVSVNVAVVSTDTQDRHMGRGRFGTAPADPVVPNSCTLAAPVTDGCDPTHSPVFEASGDLSAAAVADALRCRLNIGTDGYGFERGLEATRLALSCDGPNADLWGACCVDGQYDPGCGGPGPAPTFLRPDAALAVLFVSDEDDCSDPASNPEQTRRIICRPGATDALASDGLPLAYQDPILCPTFDPSADEQAECTAECAARGAPCDACLRHARERTCFRAECGAPPCPPGADSSPGTCRTADDCRAGRCAIDESANSSCMWYRSTLTPVLDYATFLYGLKQRPHQQLVVAALVGPRGYTAQGDEVTYNAPTEEAQLACLDERRAYSPTRTCAVDADCPGVGNRCDDSSEPPRCTGVGAEAFCCPDGACVGNVQTTCEGPLGTAFSGRRYLALTEFFEGATGDPNWDYLLHGRDELVCGWLGTGSTVGCPPGSEGTAGCADLCSPDGLSRGVAALASALRARLAR